MKPYRRIAESVVSKMNNEIDGRELRDDVHLIICQKEITANGTHGFDFSSTWVLAINHSEEILSGKLWREWRECTKY